MAELCLNLFNESGYFGPTPDLPRQIRAAASVGFDAVGLDVFSLAKWQAAGERVEDVAMRIAELGLRCPEIASLMLGPDPAENEAQLVAFEPLVRALRPDWILVNASLPSDSAQLAGEFRRAADRLGPLGAGLAFEYLAITPIDSITGTLELLDRAGATNAGVLVDTWHFFLGPGRWEELAELPLDRLAYVQFDDHPAIASDDLREETLHRRVFPGEGLFDLDRFSRVLRARGFDGLVSVEVLSQAWRGGDVEAFAKRAFQTSAPYWR